MRWLTLAFVALPIGCALFGNAYERADEAERMTWKHIGLPLRTTTPFAVKQGAFGSSSHREKGLEFSWDLAVPLGTEVIAAESGRVSDVHTPKGLGGAVGGCDPKFAPVARNVKVEHFDGTVAQYVHVDARVGVGAKVRRGDVIAVTAMNGWLCYPHLHFGVYRGKQTVPLYFDDVPGGILREGFEFTDKL